MSIDQLLSDIETLKQEAAEDSKINRVNLASEALDIPALHSRWLNKFTDEKIALRSLQLKKNKVYHERWEYYLGRADAEVYKAEPFGLKVLKGDVHIYLGSDAKLAQINAKLEIQKEKVDFIEAVLHSISQRNWNIKNAIDFLKFTQGEI